MLIGFLFLAPWLAIALVAGPFVAILCRTGGSEGGYAIMTVGWIVIALFFLLMFALGDCAPNRSCFRLNFPEWAAASAFGWVLISAAYWGLAKLLPRRNPRR